MPILIKNCQWSQTEDEIVIRVPIKDIVPSKVDILTHENFIKLHHPPYYYEVFLLHPIKDKESKCRIIDGEVKFLLKKAEKIHWETLEGEIAKTEKVKVKEEIIINVQKQGDIDRHENAIKKDERRKEEIRKEVDRESTIRETIEKLQKTACITEIETIQETQKEIDKTPERNLFIKKQNIVQRDTPRPKTNSFIRNKASIEVPRVIKENIVPEIRTFEHIKVGFTKRNFATPQRESTEPAEKDWLLKQHKARKVIGFIEEDLRPEERNPDWLKEKGDEFYKKANYLGAVSAYSTGIRLSDKRYDLYLNRAAAHFSLENYKRVIEDCSVAYDLLTPICKANLKSRKTCLARRGAALCKIGMLKQGYDELKAAYGLDPTDPVLKEDIEMIRRKLENQQATNE